MERIDLMRIYHAGLSSCEYATKGTLVDESQRAHGNSAVHKSSRNMALQYQKDHTLRDVAMKIYSVAE